MNPYGKRELSSAKSKIQSSSTKMPVDLLSPATIAFIKESSTPRKRREILKSLKTFKKFDFVEEHFPEHHFISNYSSTSSKWTKQIKKEMEMLEKDLPDTIYVRACKSRFDLLRAVIIGAEGTPYHNGLFFFDIYFPGDYPNIAPLVSCHVESNRLNPLFDDAGRLPLDRIKIWPNSDRECWIPKASNILDVLLAIHGQVFNKMPFYNEFFGEASYNIPKLESIAKLYNDNAFTVTLEMMGHTMRKPPKYFEDLVAGHFVNRAHNILESCKVFIEDGARRVVEEPAVTSRDLRKTAACVGFVKVFTNRLVLELSRVGAPNCEKFLTEEIVNADKSLYEYYEKLDFLRFP